MKSKVSNHKFITNIIELEKSGRDSLLLHALLKSIPSNTRDEFFADYTKRSKATKVANLEIEFIVNGFPMDVERFFNGWDRQSKEMIRQAAKELIKEACADMETTLGNITRQLKNYAITTAHRQIGFEYSEEDEW